MSLSYQGQREALILNPPRVVCVAPPDRWVSEVYSPFSRRYIAQDEFHGTSHDAVQALAELQREHQRTIWRLEQAILEES